MIDEVDGSNDSLDCDMSKIKEQKIDNKEVMNMIKGEFGNIRDKNQETSNRANGGTDSNRRSRIGSGHFDYWVCPFCGQRVPFDAKNSDFRMSCPTCGELMTPE